MNSRHAWAIKQNVPKEKKKQTINRVASVSEIGGMMDKGCVRMAPMSLPRGGSQGIATCE